MKKRRFYAHYCKWGANAVDANNCQRYWGDYVAFDSEKARDEWVDKYECYGGCNLVARTATRREVISQKGKYFVAWPASTVGTYVIERQYEFPSSDAPEFDEDIECRLNVYGDYVLP